MACLVVRNEQGSITDVKAPNGESSLLFQDLLKHHSGNTEKAFRAYAFTHTTTFKEWFKNSQMVDANGEPKIWYHDVAPALALSREWQKEHRLTEADDISGELGDNLGRELATLLSSGNPRFTETQPHIDHRSLTLQERALEQFTGGAITTISARPCFLYSAVPKTGQTISLNSMDQVKFVDMPGTYATEQNDDISYLPMREDEDVPTGGVAKLYQIKNNLFNIAREQLNTVEAALNRVGGDQAQREKNIKERDRLRDYLYGNAYRGIQGLKQEMVAISKIESVNPDAIEPYINKELQRVEELLLGNAEDADEATEILQFIQAVADVKLAKDNRHPLFKREELYDGEELTLPPTWVARFEQWGSVANDYAGRLNRRKEILFTEIINANPGVQAHIGEMSFAQIVKLGEGMKDTSWIDMMVMDAGSGIFSSNGIIPQAAMYEANRIAEQDESWSRDIARRTDHILPALNQALIDEGHYSTFLGRKVATYDLYQQRDENGKKRSEMVHKYSFKWQDQIANMLGRFMAKEEFSRTHDFKTEASKEHAKQDAYNYRQKWLNGNAKIMDPALIPEIADDPEIVAHGYSFGNPAEQAAHKAELVALVGEDYYQQMVKEQKDKIKDYLTQRKVLIEQYLVQEGKTDPVKLSLSAQAHIQVLEFENDPFYGARYSENNGKPFEVGDYKAHSSYRANIHLPLEGKGYYDTNYAKIEGNPTLKAFYDIAFEATSGIWERMDAGIQDKIGKGTLFGSESSLMDMLMDKDVKFMQMASVAYRRMIDAVKGSFGVNKEDPFSRRRVNAVTGLPGYEVSSGFVQNNISRINNLFIAKSAAFRGDYNNSAGVKKLPGKLGRSTTINLTTKNRAAAMSLAMQYTGLSEQELLDAWTETRENFDGSTYQVLRIGKAIESSVIDDIVRQTSFDLPKMLKVFTHAAAQYSARKRALPIIKTMGEMYKSIKNQKTTNAGEPIVNAKLDNEPQLAGLRTKAIAQWDNWFSRAILGNQGLRTDIAPTDSSEMTDEDYQNSLRNGAKTFFRQLTGKENFNGKIYSYEDKEMLENLNKAIGNAAKELAAFEARLADPNLNPDAKKNLIISRGKSEARMKSLEDMRKVVGKDVSASAIYDMLLRMVRWVGLSFNIYSGMNNVITGQVANSVMAARGQYFPPEYINEISMTEMMAADATSKAGRRFMSRKAALAKVMMEDYNILQDAADELQKNSNKSRFSGFRRFHGFYMLQKGEYYNQAPLAVAVLKDTKITDKDGNVGNVWDALEPVYDEAGKKWTKKLKDEFRTPENIASWENSNGEEYFKYKAKIRDVIKNTHGDFDPLSGMMAKTTHTGQAAMMFHTFFPRMLYLMWGAPQDNIITGVMGQKGLMRSHTKLTGTLQGAIVGTAFFGPIGSVVGGTAGLLSAMVWGRRSNLNLMQESLLVGQLLGRKMLGIPLRPIEAITGKKFLSHDREAEFLRMQGKKFDRVDYGNYQANIQLIGTMCLWTGMLLLTKAVFWDDDDDEDSWTRRMHNLLANEFMQLFDESALYSNPVKTVTTFTDFAVLKYLTKVGKAVGTLQGLLEGNDTNLSGSNRGESKSFNAFRAVLFPKLLDEAAGFGTKMERQFAASPFDHYFWGDEKNAKHNIQELKLKKREAIEASHPGADDDAIKKLLSKEVGKKRKGESYVDYLKRLSKTEAE